MLETTIQKSLVPFKGSPLGSWQDYTRDVMKFTRRPSKSGEDFHTSKSRD